VSFENPTRFSQKGHPRGGLFLAPTVSLAVAALALACGPTGTGGQPVPGDVARHADTTPNPLAVYERLDYITGDSRFPIVGKFIFLPGPADSSYIILALSLPNSALKFRRAPVGFVARYQVDLGVADGAAQTASLSEVEEVYVRTFRETSRADESVVFQGFLKLLPGVHSITIDVRDLSSGAALSVRKSVQVPRFQPPFITAPIVAYRAEPRPNRATLPAIILNPRSTVTIENPKSYVYVESSRPNGLDAIVEARTDGQVISTDTLTFRPATGELHSATRALENWQLPPGTVELRSGLGAPASATSTTLIVALTPEWVISDYQEAISYLRYAGRPSELDSLLNVAPAERARLLQAFWNRKDPVPDTPENEFFERYFRRIQEANDRFSEASTAGWLTDRGAVYITFGPPDEVLRHLDPGQGAEQRQVWVYDESLGFELRLVFVDPMATGAYQLTIESRRQFLEAVQTLYS
jgi:GWxTD domain-containing protein